jgi:hypothetical protein
MAESALKKYEQAETLQIQQQPTYDRILDLAISQGAPLEQLEKFLQLKREYEAHEAQKEFYQAVADFKGEQVLVTKDKTNTQFRSKYTSLGNLLNTVNPVLGKHGLSVSFDLKQTDKMITIACILRHRLGHTERVEMSAPPDTSGGNSKNPIQQIKSTMTYLRAATFEAVTGLASTDEANLDDDGNASGAQYISKDQAKAIHEMIIQTGANESMFLSYMKSGSVELIKLQDFNKAITALKAKAKKGGAK